MVFSWIVLGGFKFQTPSVFGTKDGPLGGQNGPFFHLGVVFIGGQILSDPSKPIWIPESFLSVISRTGANMTALTIR